MQGCFSHDMLKEAVENMQECFAYFSTIKDKDGKIIDFRLEYINKSGCINSSIEKTECLGKKLSEIICLNARIGLFEDYCKVVETGETLLKEYLIYDDEHFKEAYDISASRCGDGLILVWREITSRKFKELLMTYTKISEEKLRESEETIRALLNSITEAIAFCDLEGKIETINETAAKRYGKNTEEMIGKCIFDFMPESLAKVRKSYVSDNIALGKPVRFSDIRDRMYLDNFLYPVFNSKGEAVKFVAFTQDITERKKAEIELALKNEELEIQRTEAIKANRLKSQFLANMSHELRTPLNSIIGFTTRVIKKGGSILSQEQLENLNIVKEEAQHLLELINNLFDYSKVEIGKMEVHRETFNLTNLVEEVNSSVKMLIDGTKLDYKYELCSKENLMIVSDRIKIKQILINLLSNAIKYSEKGTIQLSISRVNNHYCIKVEDQGIGIAAENIESIFEEFRQIDGSHTRKVGGTGLGLTITKKYTEMLGGRIKVSSTLGIGSCFTVYIPIDSGEIEGNI